MRIALPARIAPTRPLDGGALVDLGGETMGTRWSVRFVSPPGCDAGAVRRAIVARLDDLVAQMSHWSATSSLMRFNRAPAGSWTILPADFAHVMAQGLAIAAATRGAFDPAIGRVVDVWGFGAARVDAPPDARAIEAALAASGWRRLVLADRCLRQPGGVSLDLSGIAKGHAADAVADLLGRMGLAHALVEIGGELAGRGMRDDGEPWWVDLEVPPGTRIAPLRIALHGLSVATSGDYVRGAHTLDPRTGVAAGHDVVSASVVHERALAADAWATALTVLGPREGVALATRAGIAGRIVAVVDGMVHEHLTPALAAMLVD